jgi:dienelactone hydrolase
MQHKSYRICKKNAGATKIGAMGYCFGAKVRHQAVIYFIITLIIYLQFVIRGFQAGSDIGLVAHPFFVKEDELVAIMEPLSIAAAKTDSIFPGELKHKSEEILAKSGLPYQINMYS